ncbi:MAG: DUF4249 family protein, partial [Melioribacteraceae bacterium]
MIKKILYLVFLIFSIFGCDDEVTFQAEYEEKEILYCVLNADSSNQYALLKTNFENKNSQQNHYIKNAKITLKQNKVTSELRDTSALNNNTETDFYYSKNFKPPLGSEIEITAELPNGKVLSAFLTVPNFSLFVFQQSLLTIPSSQDPTRLYIGWTLRNGNDNLAFLTRLIINYRINKNNIETEHSYTIPIEYIIKNDNTLPVHPQIGRSSFQVYSQQVIDRAFREISIGDTNKSAYTIVNANLEIFVLEENLTNYSASVEAFKNSYSVKVYEPQISNIEGGLGVFGAFIK